MTRKSLPIVVVILIAITLTVSLFFFIQPSIAGPQIDDSWMICVNLKDKWDPTSAEWVQETYGGKIVDLNAPQDYNTFGQNIFIIGGSKALSWEAEWIGFKPHWYGIQQPNTYPSVYVTEHFDDNGNPYGWEIHTPVSMYLANPENDVGWIAKGYDYALRRWVVVVIGYSYHSTAYGSKLVCTQWSKVVGDNSYVVFECTKKGGFEPTLWDFDDFDGTILEYGG